MIFFENAKESFYSASGTINKYNSESKFYHNFARMIPDKIDVDTLVLAFKIALQDAERNVDNTFPFITLVPQYVRQCTSPEFAHEFRKKYNAEVLGLTQEELPSVDYGYNEVEPDVIDISDKDRNEVLAALYNASTPTGMGFVQYNPMPWTKEIAAMYFERFVELDKDDVIALKWVMGRPLNCKFINNLVYVAGYNNDNELGLAQRAIATCPNIQQKKHYKNLNSKETL